MWVLDAGGALICITPVLTPLAALCVSDINELNLPKTCEIEFSDHDDLLNFKLVICPDEVSVSG